VGSPTGGAGPPLATPACGEATLAHYCPRPFAYIVVPENLSEGGGGIRDRHVTTQDFDNFERNFLPFIAWDDWNFHRDLKLFESIWKLY
jgi:hypothetical protein